VSYRLEEVGSSRDPAFAECYEALAAEFAPRGELERRAVIERWLDEPKPVVVDGLERSYHLLVARDERGSIAGVRDCHVILDRRGVVIVYLAHALVLPTYRRSGLGALLRRAPIAIGERAITEAGLARVDLVLAAEMEPASAEELSIVRLSAYAKDGFFAIDPSVLPYCQPDFRDLGPTETARPIPLLAVVRYVGHDDARTLPRRLARAFVTHLYAVFASHVRRDHLTTLETATFRALDAHAEDDVPLLPLPRTRDDARALSQENVLRSFPQELR
jgi:GNAT superfamily N-acetyltransferase